MSKFFSLFTIQHIRTYMFMVKVSTCPKTLSFLFPLYSPWLPAQKILNEVRDRFECLCFQSNTQQTGLRPSPLQSCLPRQFHQPFLQYDQRSQEIKCSHLWVRLKFECREKTELFAQISGNIFTKHHS